MSCETGLLKGYTEREAAGDHPEHAPVDFLKIPLGEYSGDGEDADWQHCHDIGVDSGELVGHPEEDGNGECHIYHVISPCPLVLAFNLQFNGLLLEREDFEEDNPGNEEEKDCKWGHECHPLSESDVHVHSHRVIEIFQCDSVRRGSDRCSDTADVGCDRNCESKCNLSLSVSR